MAMAKADVVVRDRVVAALVAVALVDKTARPRAVALLRHPKKERSERDSKVLRDEDKFDADGVELCRNFRNTGECRFGDNCTYSHVPGGPIGHPAKRAVAGECYEFKEKGACKFGAECRFKHGDGDGRTEVPRKRSKPAA